MKNPTGYVVLVDGNRTRRHMLAELFRDAGCMVVETTVERDIERTLAKNIHPWVVALADHTLTPTFFAAHTQTPILRIGYDHQSTIAGRVTMAGSPQLGPDLHALVASRAQVN